MEEYKVRILATEQLTHDVKRYSVEKPAGYAFVPGQATELAVDEDGWREERRPFTFTSLNDWDHLEFTIKTYPDHKGVTQKLAGLQPGDHLLIHDVWGAIQYKGEGLFIAGGAGITPFIAIFRQLRKDRQLGKNRLLFSNKTHSDIILENEFETMLGDRFIRTLTAESYGSLPQRRIDENFLKEYITGSDQHFYICGPDAMVAELKSIIEKLAGPQAVVTVEV